MTGVGVAAIIAGGFVFFFFLGGYLFAGLRKPLMEPVGQGAWTGEDRQRRLEAWRARNKRLRPRYLHMCVAGAVLAVIGVVLVVAGS